MCYCLPICESKTKSYQFSSSQFSSVRRSVRALTVYQLHDVNEIAAKACLKRQKGTKLN